MKHLASAAKFDFQITHVFLYTCCDVTKLVLPHNISHAGGSCAVMFYFLNFILDSVLFFFIPPKLQDFLSGKARFLSVYKEAFKWDMKQNRLLHNTSPDHNSNLLCVLQEITVKIALLKPSTDNFAWLPKGQDTYVLPVAHWCAQQHVQCCTPPPQPTTRCLTAANTGNSAGGNSLGGLLFCGLMPAFSWLRPADSCTGYFWDPWNPIICTLDIHTAWRMDVQQSVNMCCSCSSVNTGS